MDLKKNLNGSLISEDIAKFYRHVIPLDKKADCDIYFHNSSSYNFKTIAELILLPQQQYQDLQNYSYDDFLDCYERLLPVFVHSEIVAHELRSQQKRHIINLEWLGTNSKHLKYFINIYEYLPTYEFILLTTSLLEKSLGDIFLAKSGQVTRPHLLKDLLTTQELIDVFGLEAIIFLRILLGLPKCINLRNIVWHGFPQPNDIPAYYASVLLLLVHSLGCVIKSKGLENYETPHFDCQNKFTQKKVFSPLGVEHTMDLVAKCTLLNEEYKKYWQQICSYYAENLLWLFMLVILPQIELLLRIKYGKDNNIDVCAKLDEYYITMDTIFESTLPQKKEMNNELLETSFSSGVLNCIYDYFVALSGPRIRDKVSHGEIILESTNGIDVHVLLLIATSLLSENQADNPLADYESELHLNSMTKSYYALACNELSKLSIKYSNDVLCSHEQPNEIILLHKLKIFNRPRRDREFMNILYEILILIIQIAQQYGDAIETRKELLNNKKLHSRRRRTLEKMLAILPNTISVMKNITECCGIIFLKLQNDNHLFHHDDKAQKQLLRFLKTTLAIGQKLSKYSAKHNNEWIKAVEVCDKFIQNRDIFFNFYDNAHK